MTPSGTTPAAPVDGARFQRLTHRQWENATRDLLRLPARSGLSSTFQSDPLTGKFANGAAILFIDENLRQDYRDAAEALAEKATADAAALARLLPAGLPASGDARTKGFLEAFGLRAYRRPLTAAELTRYTALFAKGKDAYPAMDVFAAGVRVTVEALLQSTHFLHRTELAAAGATRTPLSSYERAAKLALALTQSIPDDELLTAAVANGLATAEAVRKQAERLMATAGAAEMLDDFHAQLLRLRTYDQIEKDAKTFATFAPGIGVDMRNETQAFVRDVVGSGGGVRELLTSTSSFVNKRLAAIYEVPAPAADAMTKVTLDGKQRAGLLTQLGFLAANAGAKEIDSIHRGVFVHEYVLCTHLPPPAAGVSLSGAKGTTNRQRITSVTGDGTCGAGCHSAVINPVGFAFERYDAIGHHRLTDNGEPADASGRYGFDGGPEIAFDDAIGFTQAAANSKSAHECYTRGLLEYLHGRAPAAADDGAVQTLGARSLKDRLAAKALVLELVSSDAFLSRSR